MGRAGGDEVKLTKAQDRALSFIRNAGAVRIDAYGCLVRDDGEKTNASGATTAARRRRRASGVFA